MTDRKMKLIPAIDIMNGKCVRLTQGDFRSQKVYSENPIEMAKHFEGIGFTHLHLIDLDGTKAGKISNPEILKGIAEETNLTIEFGGGITTEQDADFAFELGATQVIIGSMAVKNPELFMKLVKKYAPQKVILAADCINQKVAIDGWQNKTECDVIEHIDGYEKRGVHYAICTSIDKDGMLQGTANELYSEIIDKSSIQLIASGGVTTIDDLFRLNDLGCYGAILGKALYEKSLSVDELMRVY